MELFDKNTKMTALVHSNHLLLPVLNRFGLRLGFQEKTVEEICAEKNIDLNFFLAIVNAYHHHNYSPENELKSISAKLIIDYLRKSHLDFLKISMPKIEAALDKMVKNRQSNDLKIIQKFYSTYKEEFLEHIQDEEEHAFPYVLALQKAHDEKINPLPKNIAEYSISDYEKDHGDVDVKLFDLKNLIIKYLKPDYSDQDCNEFLYELFHFERDVQDHARIEDQILVTKVLEIEKELKHA